MGRNFSFRTRLLLSFWIVLFLALLLPPWYYYRILTQEVLDEAQRSAIKQLNLVHWMLNQAADTQTIEDLHGWLVQVGDQVGARITYMAEGGRVVADSQVPSLKYLTWTTTPTVRKSFNPKVRKWGWRSASA